ncbi:hypothetical protein MSG28_010805 [Choristoneura fumiferana]|uniref:Uncharacterized protein n=1 Tax=Choristoneura fumiferana TaxID=7141 RepID=A0ACC0KNT7_CHOFU|nr:hypothetical protein MSG28_010805 [Choristoneura fumiferana]
MTRPKLGLRWLDVGIIIIIIISRKTSTAEQRPPPLERRNERQIVTCIHRFPQLSRCPQSTWWEACCQRFVFRFVVATRGLFSPNGYLLRAMWPAHCHCLTVPPIEFRMVLSSYLNTKYHPNSFCRLRAKDQPINTHSLTIALKYCQDDAGFLNEPKIALSSIPTFTLVAKAFKILRLALNARPSWSILVSDRSKSEQNKF